MRCTHVASIVPRLHAAVPIDNEDLRQIDLGNKMPWQNGTEINTDTLKETLTESTKGSCEACEPYGDETLTQEQIERAIGTAYAAWVSGLLDNNSTAIANEYCDNATLWGTVTAMRRNTNDEIKSYFDWFAPSRNFTEEIKSTCPKVTKLGPGMFIVSEQLRLGDQCLKMQFTILTRPDGSQCVASLDSSYTPSTPELLAALDAGEPAPSPSSSASSLLGAGHVSLWGLAVVALIL